MQNSINKKTALRVIMQRAVFYVLRNCYKMAKKKREQKAKPSKKEE